MIRIEAIVAAAQFEAAQRSRLTRRQLQVVALVNEGQSHEQIAAALGIHIVTVRYHHHAALIMLARAKTNVWIQTFGDY